MVLHVNVPGPPPTRVVLNHRMNTLVVRILAHKDRLAFDQVGVGWQLNKLPHLQPLKDSNSASIASLHVSQ